MIELCINGESRAFPPPSKASPDTSLTLAGLVEQLGYTGKRIAVEKNGEIVPKSQHATTVLVTGDRLEIVVAVGGG